MRAAKSALLLFFCLILGEKLAAKSDSTFVRHRISVLPTQIILQEYSLFYEYQVRPVYALEVSLGYQTFFQEWYERKDFDFEFKKGIVLRATAKYFPSPILRSIYIAPMGLFKILSDEELSASYDWRLRTDANYVTNTIRKVLGLYGLVGYRTGGKLFLDIYGGLGLRFIRDDVRIQTLVNNESVSNIFREEVDGFIDLKFGMKLGVTLF